MDPDLDFLWGASDAVDQSPSLRLISGWAFDFEAQNP